MRQLKFFLFTALLIFPVMTFAFNDPTQGKPFIPWIWEDQFKPTLKKALDVQGLWTLTAGVAATVTAFQYDEHVYQHNLAHDGIFMNDEESTRLGVVGSGVLGVSIAVAQLFYDQENGLMHARAIALTSVNHLIIALIALRERPGNRGDYLPFKSSFPSGHAASAFASATSLSYAYGWKAGVPAFLIASSISIARISENAHWLSDIVAGASLGFIWSRASYRMKEEKDNNHFNFIPFSYDGGLFLLATKNF